MGLVPTKEAGSFRLIHHLSFPSEDSVNDFIYPKLFLGDYTSFDAAVHMVQVLGQCCLLGKSDIKNAFRLLLVSPLDFDQLGYYSEEKYFLSRLCHFDAVLLVILTGERFCYFFGILHVQAVSRLWLDFCIILMITCLVARREPTIVPIVCLFTKI